MQGACRSLRQWIERESLLLSGNGHGELAKHGEQDGRSMQNIGITGAKRSRALSRSACAPAKSNRVAERRKPRAE